MSVPTPSELQSMHPRERVDRLRRALRQEASAETAGASELEAWLEFYRRFHDPALRVLILQLFDGRSDDAYLALLHESVDDRGDGVRLEALRQLIEFQPELLREFSQTHRDDDSLEVRLLLAMRLAELDRPAALEWIVEILLAEARGMRELHALERGMEFLVEDIRAVEITPKLREIRDEFHDTEDFFGWALEKLEGREGEA